MASSTLETDHVFIKTAKVETLRILSALTEGTAPSRTEPLENTSRRKTTPHSMKLTRRWTRRNKKWRRTRHRRLRTLQISTMGENGAQERTFLESPGQSLERTKEKRPRQRSIRPTVPSHKVIQQRHVGRVQDYQTQADTDSSLGRPRRQGKP